MFLLNFAHPFTTEQLNQIILILGQEPTIRYIPSRIDRSRPITQVAKELADAAFLSDVEWQTSPLVVNPPPLAVLALILITELHGRCGYFIPILNIMPTTSNPKPHYVVNEIVNLQQIRELARQRRKFIY